ncbi:uncharacterized protein LOC110047089 [Orbicella faveolata]|uniref:uncharacterized protein LOC110047089 n=1 Tax=Orbicella faveolata TaxID=48498 RepID=UPI0009E51C04|nr:uncharacterized protein LOC110047089 [Orbicella faveolata]
MLSISAHQLPMMHNGQVNKTVLHYSHNRTGDCHGDGKNASCITEIDSSSEECGMNVAVVIVVVLVIMAWFIGYIFLQKVEERKEKTKNSVNQRRRTLAIP